MSFDLVQIIKDRDTGRPKGYGFVMFENPDDAKDAIYGMDQKARYIDRLLTNTIAVCYYHS